MRGELQATGQAAGVCARPDPDAARRIQEAMVRLDDREMLLAFQAVTGDRQTAAPGGPGGGAAGGPGGGGVGGIGSGGNGGGGSGFFGNSTSVLGNTNAGGQSAGSPALALRQARAAGSTLPPPVIIGVFPPPVSESPN